MTISDKIALASLFVALAGVVIAIITAKDHLSGVFSWLKSKVQSVSSFDYRRRNVLVSGGALFIGIIGAPYIIKLYSSLRLKCDSIASKLTGNEFIVNLATGTLHHKQICANHIHDIKQQGTVTEFGKCSHLHKANQIQIVNVLINSKRLGDEVKETLLLETITISPTTTHLYKPLIRMWGGRKEYNKIHQLLAANIEYFDFRLARKSITLRERKQFDKARNELLMRQAKAKRLAKLAKLQIS